jgi:site-specific DNA-cytosine methylase
MKVLSLFDGMACGYEALERAWIKVDKYYASEIDKYAIQIATNNHPDIIEIWDVCNVKWEDYQDIDLLIWGSPCQWFSVAGKMLNFNDPRSKLFFEYVRILREVKPKYFLLENVKMKKEWQDIISRELWVEPIEINSSLVSAQNRRRLYRTNIPNVSQPKDKGILLKDILEQNVDEKYYFSRERRDRIVNWKYDIIKRTEDIEWKCATLVTNNWWNHEKKIFIPCWTQYSSSENFWNSFGSQKGYTLRASCPNGVIEDIGIVRKLTPIECERLQTLPDNYTEWVSDSQRYKMLGNWWTVDVISHIFKHLK